MSGLPLCTTPRTCFGHPVGRFKVICSTATAPVPGPAALIRTLPWPTAQLWQLSFAEFLPLEQAKGILQAVDMTQPPVFQIPPLAGWAQEDWRSCEAGGEELPVLLELFFQPGLEWSLGKQQL